MAAEGLRVVAARGGQASEGECCSWSSTALQSGVGMHERKRELGPPRESRAWPRDRFPMEQSSPDKQKKAFQNRRKERVSWDLEDR